MTELDIQKNLFDTFCNLNSFSGIDFLRIDENDNYLNVHFPNIQFDAPSDKRWFELTFRNNEPVDNAILGNVQNRFTGVLYIDIITPHDVGEYEALNKYRWIAKLFNSANIDDVDIMKVYISTKGNEADHYRLQVAVEWTADIDKEL